MPSVPTIWSCQSLSIFNQYPQVISHLFTFPTLPAPHSSTYLNLFIVYRYFLIFFDIFGVDSEEIRTRVWDAKALFIIVWFPGGPQYSIWTLIKVSQEAYQNGSQILRRTMGSQECTFSRKKKASWLQVQSQDIWENFQCHSCVPMWKDTH